MKTKYLLMPLALLMNTQLFADDSSPAEDTAAAAVGSTSEAAPQARAEPPHGGYHIPVMNTPTPLIPKNIISPSYAFVNVNIKDRFDDKGKKEPLLGLKVNVNVNTYGLWYGLTQNKTITFTMPYTAEAKTSVDSLSNLRASKEYNGAKAGFTAGVIIPKLIQDGACTNFGDCQGKIAAGMTFPTANPGLGYSAGTPVAAYITGATDRNFTSTKTGSGLSDINMTLNTEHYNAGNWTFKSRTKLTVPTGKYAVDSSENATGDGKYVANLYGDAEYTITPGVVGIFEHGVGYDLTSNKDINGEKSRFEGLTEEGGLYVCVDPGRFFPALNFVGVTSGYQYNYSPSQSISPKTGSAPNLAQSSLMSNRTGIRFSGLNYHIPVFVDYIHNQALSGKNDGAATTNVFLFVGSLRL